MGCSPHFGRGRGNWSEQHYPESWLKVIDEIMDSKKESVGRDFNQVIFAVFAKIYPTAKM